MPSENRFSDTFSSPSPRIENQPLWRGEHVVVLPTLGMVVPNWFLIVPEIHTLNFAQQADATRNELSALAASIFDAVSVSGDELLIFEHGAQRTGSAVGCGLDHAHLHVVVGASALVSTVWSAMESDLRVEPTETPLGLVDKG
jgi:diadenosine tetraphosphate (Ap4A) HIT family hydrolase